MASIATRDIAVGDHHLHVSTSGDPTAQPLLLLHGSGPGATGLSNWEGALVALGDDFYCIAPDLLGFGDSTHPDPAPVGIAAFGDARADSIIDLLDVLGIGTTHVVGNSMGGMIAMVIRRKAAERLDHIVLMGSGGAPFPPTEDLIKMVTFPQNPTQEAMEALLTRFVYEPSLFGDQLAEIAAARLPRATRPDVLRSHLATFGGGPTIKFSPDELAAVDNEVLLIHGQDDRFIPVAASHFFFEHLPNAQLHIIKKCGHWAQIEHGSTFHALVRGFLPH